MRKFAGCVAVLLAVAACSSSGHGAGSGSTSQDSGSPPPSSAAPQVSVTSTLDGHTTLPHRIHWVAKAQPLGDITEVDFLVDGKQLWVENNAPYYYGDDGNYLVTSFLKPGKHEFTVRAIDTEGASALDSVTATVASAPRPPAALAGTWKAFDHHSGHQQSLVISSVGWTFDAYPPNPADGNGGLLDVAYLQPGLLEVRTGMATGHDTHNGASVDADLNGWCNDAPGSPVRMRWSVSGDQLRLTFVSGSPCEGFLLDMRSPWHKVSGAGQG